MAWKNLRTCTLYAFRSYADPEIQNLGSLDNSILLCHLFHIAHAFTYYMLFFYSFVNINNLVYGLFTYWIDMFVSLLSYFMCHIKMCITADNYAVLYHYRPCWIYKSVGFVFCLHQSFLKLCSISLTTLDMYVFHFYNVCDYPQFGITYW